MTEPEHADPQRYVELAGFEGDWRETWWNHDWLELAAHRLALHEVTRALDVGCGAGHWGRTLLAHLPATASLVGVDRVDEFLRMSEAGARAKGFGDRTSYVRGTAEALPFADAIFDLVTCQTVLIHVADAAVAVAEMRRVTRPGGLVVAAEPDNLASTLAFLGTSIATPREDVLALIDLQIVCEAGKLALGEGDNSVGARLPGIFAAAGLRDVVVWGNDKCARLVPPYATKDEQLDLAMQLGWQREGAWFTGTEHDSRRLFEAGGGDPAAFDRLWAKTLAWGEAFAREIAAGTFHAARGLVHYLVCGRAQ